MKRDDVTALLRRWEGGDPQALDELMPIVYDRLRDLARRRLGGDRDALLDTTGLVHEAYMKLVDASEARVADRRHFLNLASRIMRNLLVDHARARRAGKRGGGAAMEPLREAALIADETVEPLLQLDGALERLGRLDARRARILEHRYFGGLSLEEVAEALDISLATVKRELRTARAWLAAELTEGDGPAPSSGST